MATILPTGETTFLDANGTPLAGGTVTFYIPGTTTPKDTWQNSGQSILNPNPVTLDSGGRAIIYGSGTYRQVVQDSLGNIIWDQQTSEPNAGSVSFGGTSAGTVNAQTLSSAQFSFVDGQIISFVAGLTNTGATTMSLGGSSPVSVVKNGTTGPVALVASDIVAGNSYFIQYSTALAAFQLLLSVAPAVPTGAFLRGYLFGLTLSNDVSDPVNDFDITTGATASDGSTPFLMTLSSALIKRTDAAWAVGTNQGCLDTGAVSNGNFHIFLIQRSDTGVVDVLASLNALAPTMPANYDRKRRVGTIIREAATIVPFTQSGNIFRRSSVVQRNALTAQASILLSLSIPTGVQVRPIMLLALTVTTNSLATNLFGDAQAGSADTVVQLEFAGANDSVASSSILSFGEFLANTSGQVYFAATITAGTIATNTLTCLGWIDDRGQTA
jgi:hypothetical protein